MGSLGISGKLELARCGRVMPVATHMAAVWWGGQGEYPLLIFYVICSCIMFVTRLHFFCAEQLVIIIL